MGNYFSPDPDNPHKRQAVLNDNTVIIAQMLADTNDWPGAELYFLKVFEVKTMKLTLDQHK